MSTETDNILVVLLHAYNSSSERLAGIERLAREAYAPARIEVLRPELPLHKLSTADPTRIAADVANQIDKLHKDHSFTRIVLVGHSVGSLIARKLYIIACGETDKAPLEKSAGEAKPREWAHRVERIVLMAGINRGWRVSHHLSLSRAAIWWCGVTAPRMLEMTLRMHFLILRIRVGSSFITQLRIQWLRMRQAAKQDERRAGRALIIQLLGSIDDMVSPRDNVDLVAGSDFIYLDVPYSSHKSVVDIDDTTEVPDGSGTTGALRSAMIRTALAGSRDELDNSHSLPDDLDSFASPFPTVRDVVFVIHGIRDGGYWTHKIARMVRKQSGRDSAFVATETSTYGYFPMLPFLFTFQRRKKVEWLMDEYARAVALYPNAARFHFVGHSNGTYCLVDALERYPCCRFANVVLAGSVARSGLEWKRFLVDHQTREQRKIHGSVRKVLNFVATADWVVAFFPRLFETWLPIQKLGGAGHRGFLRAPADAVENVTYVKGSHGAGIVEPLWPNIARFVLTGTPGEIPRSLLEPRQSLFVWTLGWVPILVWGLGLWLLWNLGEWLWRVSVPPDAASPGWIAGVLMSLYVIGVVRLLRWI